MEYTDLINFVQVAIFSDTHSWVQIWVGLWLAITSSMCFWHSDYKNLAMAGLALLGLVMLHYGVDSKTLLHTDFLWVITFLTTAQTMSIVRWCLIKANCRRISNLLKYRTALLLCLGISCACSWLITGLI